MAPVVQKVDNAIHQINHYPVDSASLTLIRWTVIYPVDSAIQLLNNWGQKCTTLNYRQKVVENLLLINTQ